jgi:cleavage and polyadenylation specificity factor subunit 4
MAGVGVITDVDPRWVWDQMSFDFDQTVVKKDQTTSLGPTVPNNGMLGDGEKDARRGTVVCTHWLKGLCMKDDDCEFLHQVDPERMPECRHGLYCMHDGFTAFCPLRHVAEKDRDECTYFKQGFCMHGPQCKYRHVKRAASDLPALGNFSIEILSVANTNKRRKPTVHNEFYKTSLCKHWAQSGVCQFGEDCIYAHGEGEVRAFPGKDAGRRNQNQTTIAVKHPSQGGAKPTTTLFFSENINRDPNLPDNDCTCRYFVLKVYPNGALSGRAIITQSSIRSVWTVRKKEINPLNDALKSCDKVGILFDPALALFDLE